MGIGIRASASYISALALEARRRAAAGAQGGREDVRRLGRRDDSGL